jgi:hypothetical protein
MSGINDLIERRLKAERKLIADWIKLHHTKELGLVNNIFPMLAYTIECGEYLTMEKNNDSPS